MSNNRNSIWILKLSSNTVGCIVVLGDYLNSYVVSQLEDKNWMIRIFRGIHDTWKGNSYIVFMGCSGKSTWNAYRQLFLPQMSAVQELIS